MIAAFLRHVRGEGSRLQVLREPYTGCEAPVAPDSVLGICNAWLVSQVRYSSAASVRMRKVKPNMLGGCVTDIAYSEV